MKLRMSDLFWGLALIVLGFGFGGEALGYWDFEFFFRGFWTLFIIIPCGMSIFEKGFRRGNLIGLGIGIALLLSQWIPLFEDLLVPLILIVIGLVLILIKPHQSSDSYTFSDDHDHQED